MQIGDRVGQRIGDIWQGEEVELSQITIGVRNTEHVDKTATIVETLLKKFHDQDDYAVVVPKELLRQAERTKTMFNVLLAGISLLAGGIGIMNIMLSTVTERTREIGIRRALGAKRSNIIQQFMSEAVLLTGIAGMLGVVAGFFCAPLCRLTRRFVTRWSEDLLSDIVYLIEPRIAIWPVVLSVAIALITGIAFGLYPAVRAAYIDPIEALRHE